MKNLILFFILLISFTAYSQTKVKETDVPKEVLLGLENVYLSYKVKAWYKAPSQYIADIVVDGQSGKTFFTPDGSWQYSSFPVTEEELPSLANSYFVNNYPGYKIRRTEYIEEMNGDNYYRMIIAEKGVGTADYELLFNARGSIIKSNAPDPEVAKKQYLLRSGGAAVAESGVDHTPPAAAEGDGKTAKPKKSSKKQLDIEAQAHEAEDKPTAEVQAAFDKKYPATRISKGPEWGMREENHVAKFENKTGATLEVLYTPEGKLISTGSRLAKDRYPKQIIKYLDTKYRGEKYKVERIDRVDFDTKYKDPKTGLRPKTYFYVVISQKVKGQKDKKLTRLTFDNTYKYSGLLATPQDKFDKNY